MTRLYLEIGAVFVIVALAIALVVSQRTNPSLIRAQTQVEAAQEVARSSIDQAQAVLDSNKVLRHRASGYLTQAAEAETEARRAQEALRAARARMTATAVPDTCLDVVEAHRDVIVAAEHLAQVRLVELAAMTAAHGEEQKRADKAERALSNLIAATSGLDTAATKLIRASNRSIWQKLRPQPVIAVTAGIDAKQQFATIVGVGFGWTF